MRSKGSKCYREQLGQRQDLNNVLYCYYLLFGNPGSIEQCEIGIVKLCVRIYPFPMLLQLFWLTSSHFQFNFSSIHAVFIVRVTYLPDNTIGILPLNFTNA